MLRTAPGCKQGLTPAPTSLSTPSPRRCLLKKSLRPGPFAARVLAITPRVECDVYRPRRPEGTPLYRLLESRYEPVKGAWEDRFENRYGFWRGMVDGAVARYLDCGIFENGFARLHCGGCRRDVLVAFSCKGRGLCPSCGAKRGAATAARFREEVLEAVGHAQWVFTVPKMLRPFFLRHRELLGDLCRAAWDTVREMLAAGAAEEIRPAMVAVVQTFGQRVNFHLPRARDRESWRVAQGRHVGSSRVRGFGRRGESVSAPRLVILAETRIDRRGAGAVAALVAAQRVLRPQLGGGRAGGSRGGGAADPIRDARARGPRAAPLRRCGGGDGDPFAAGEQRRTGRPANDEPDGQPRERVDADELVARVIAQVPDPRRHLNPRVRVVCQRRAREA